MANTEKLRWVYKSDNFNRTKRTNEQVYNPKGMAHG